MAVFRVGSTVEDRRNPHRVYRGTVVETRGTMYNDTAVLVLWEGGYGTCWEDPDILTSLDPNQIPRYKEN